MQRFLPTTASFLVTEDCNFRCTYCFEKHNNKKMTKEVARKGLEFLCNNAIENKDNNFHAMIFGGEPLLMPDIVEEILKYGLELAKRSGIGFTANIITNASLLTPEIKNMLAKYRKQVGLNVQLSIDGIKEVHDKYRVDRNGKPTFDKIEKLIPEWKDLFKDSHHSISVHGCSNNDTLPFLYQNYLYFREVWGIERIWFMPIHSETWTDKDLVVYEEQLGLIAKYALDNARRTGTTHEIDNYAPLDRCLRNQNSFPQAPCGAGKNFITITASGEIYPCHQIYFNDPEHLTKIGDLSNGLDELSRALFRDVDNSDFSCAKLDPDCDAYACYRCMGENLNQNGSILSTVDCGGVRCKMSKLERKIQLQVKEELISMGLLNNGKNLVSNSAPGNNPNNPNCLCDSRGGNECDVVANVNTPKSHKDCGCGDKGCKDNDNDTIAMALQMILEKMESIESSQTYIIKSLLK